MSQAAVGSPFPLPASALERLVTSLLGRQFWITACLMFGLGLILPGDYGRLRPLVPLFLGGILFFSCLRLSLQEMGQGVTLGTARTLAWTIPWRLALMPLVAGGLTWLIAPSWAAGVMLLAASPAAMSSVAFTDLYGGTRMFALLQMLGTTMLAPLTVPLLLAHVHLGQGVAAGAAGGHPLAARMLYMATVLGIPFILAQLTRRAVPRLVARNHHRLGLGAVLCSCTLVFIATASNRAAWASWHWSALAVPLLLSGALCLSGLGVGMLATRWLLPRGEGIAFCCGEIWINNGLAVAFVTQFFPGNPYMLLPAILMQLPIIAVMSFFGWFVRFRHE